MRKFFRYIRRYFEKVYVGLLFVLSIVIIIYLFPTEGKFRYEFQKGKPWMHENLIAPFDFAIKKTEETIRLEKDSILRQFKPHFTYDSTVLPAQLEKFRKHFNLQWEDFIQDQYPDLEELKNDKKERKLKELKETKKIYQNFTVRLLEFIYKNGIIEYSEVLGKASEKNYSIMVLRGKLANEREVSELFTPKSAYAFIKNKIASSFEEKLSEENKNINEERLLRIRDFLQNLNMHEYISPNLYYDQQTSEKVKQNMLENISLTVGMKQAGEDRKSVV